jgi:holo-[acyl-carrier protein] synthase
MILRTGIDMVEIDRVARLVQRYGQRFLRRVYTERELIECEGRTESLAARFAAKEAAAKALGCGIGPVAWTEIELWRVGSEAPALNLTGNAARIAAGQGLTQWSVSLSHTPNLAIAAVVALGA